MTNSEGREAYPLFKGATRLPLVFGVPMIAGLFAFAFVASLAMLFSLWLWLLIAPIYLGMRAVIKDDDRAFHIWVLWFETKWRNRNRFIAPTNKKYWGGSSYSPVRYR